MTTQTRLLNLMLLIMPHIAIGQNRLFTSELQLGTDNDNFIAYTTTDRNYTYGVNVAYRWRPNNEIFFNKWFPNKSENYFEFGLNLKAYTPNYLNASAPEDNCIERPFAGWSYITFKTAYTFKESYARLGVEAGILGPASQAGQFQNWFHKNISDDESVDWTGQIPNQFGFNLKGNYAYNIYDAVLLDVYSNTEVSLGNIFTYLWPQLNLRVGQFNKITESVVTQNSVLAKSKANEFFLEYGLGMKLSAYNATVQGNIFNGNSNFRNNNINNTVFTMHLGLNFSFNRFSILVKYQYGTGEFEQTQVHRYGMLNFLYRF